MIKLFIDDINEQGKKHLQTPSPDKYYKYTGFGDKGVKYSMSSRLRHSGLKFDDRHDYYLDQQRKYPAPGSYNHIDVLGKSSSISMIKSSRVSTIPKAQDRFITVTDKSPAPNMYKPTYGIGKEVSSVEKTAPRAKIGQNKIDILDQQYSLKQAKEVPGPGKYESFSEFQGK